MFRDSTPSIASIRVGHASPSSRLTPGAIADLVLQREPALASLDPLVRLVCERPWEIRRPRDLASAYGRSLRTVRRQVAKVGFLRVEHFLTCVRHVALEQLATCLHFSLPAARRLVGIADRANARRQLRRARRSTPGGGLRVTPLVA